ncbi:MAG: serine acetyltransferase [Clostridiales Family XIII bacterium]|nr:serine acetyltransferase [Clostridiales Family XIII bacterium]
MGKYSESAIRGLVDAIVNSYEEEPDIIWMGDMDPIDPAQVQAILDDLRNLIFAGFYDKRKLKPDSVEYYAGEVVERLLYELRKQIGKALKAASGSGGALQESPKAARIEERAEQLAVEFLARIPALRAILATDVSASFEGDPAAFSKDEVVLSYPGIFAITVFRLAHELYQLDVPLIPRMMTEHAHSLTGIDIHPGATIGHHFFLDHGTGVVIGETTVIGNFVKIYQGVSLGALSTRGGQLQRGVKRHPTIEDHVTIYSGASILGGTTVVGEGVVIGSNAFITKSVPERTRVSVKNPELQYSASGREKARVIELEQDDAWYYVI